MILRPRSALTASMSCFISRIRSSIGRCSSNAAGSDDLRLASASRLLFFLFMRLVCLGLFFIHRQACLLGGQTTNRIFNYAADIPWRASGYFASGTNRSPVHLHVDAKGMMSDGQSPIAMPVVKFLPDVVKPEFTAGWGEDNDSDGLPDIYEVLVTHTDPDHADTGNTGILDGDKEITGDSWSNLEKFRLRVDPLQPAHPPAP